MISVQTELKLAHLFKAISDGEKEIEITRQVLAELNDFEPYTAFKRLDRLANGYLAFTDIYRFLRENDIILSETDVKILVKLHDTNADDRLSYTDFLNMVLPNTSPALRKLCTSRSSYQINKYDKLPYEAEWALARVINKEIDFFQRIELLKEDLVSRYDWNEIDSFKLIDCDRIGYLTHGSLYYFLKRNNIQATDDDILAIYRRIDHEGTGKINYSLFINTILPIQQSYPDTTNKIAEKSYIYSSAKKRASPLASPMRKSISPGKRPGSRMSYVSPNTKLTNKDYIEYLSESANRLTNRLSTKDRRSANRLDQETRLYSPSRFGRSANRLDQESKLYSPSRYRRDEYPNDPVAIDELRLTKSDTYHIKNQRMDIQQKEHDLNRFASPSRLTTTKKTIQSPMKGYEEENLALCLKQQLHNERDLEDIKNELAVKSDFNLLDAFRFFDINGKGYIHRAELEEGMRYFKVYPTTTELYLLMKKYDVDNDSLLKYTEFCNMISPKSEEYAGILAKRVPTYADNDSLDLIFSRETKKAFGYLLKMLIENELNAEELRQRLNSRPLFNIYEAFKALDKHDIGYLGIEEFKNLLMEHGIYASAKDVLNLVSRYDKNQDGRVTYSEFVQEITPKSPTRLY